MAQRYQIQFDSFDGLQSVVRAIENFSEKRFLSSLHLKSSMSLEDIISMDSEVLTAISHLQKQHADLQAFSKEFNNQFVTRDNHYFNSAHQLLRKIHTGATQVKHIYRRLTPNSTAAVPNHVPANYVKPSIYERSALGAEAYTQPLYGIESYPPEVQNLYNDMNRFFSLLRDSLLLCIEVIRQEEYIRRDAGQCCELYNKFKGENYLRIKRHINSINILSKEFDAFFNPAIDLRQSCATEEEFAQKAFHDQEFEDVCTLTVKELVEEEQRGEYTKEELLLFSDDREKIRQVRYIIQHFDQFIPADYKRATVPANLVACLMWWCDPKEDKAFVEYFTTTYRQTNHLLRPPSNPAVNQAKRKEWRNDPDYSLLISQWDNVEIA